ncbi:hypothetical protein AMAG_03384 [Allomyces macrogynus ATCC 38327]|uniref:Uncharacterized protein n=1 Tax=Allomyces macrogynus (strain ATCC 38327) TaxID=578462 RepID=A0A0L0S9G5_ALLM3|nr:hypothetical protein AMAG_03384 [Allomyces macrogynus ATCC 38327]|eukprot:KNE59034.1 hypothetical protein AMAG_03384 [Allomyces macrogynus ATCC 38327]
MSAHSRPSGPRTAGAGPFPDLPEVQINGVTAPSAEYWPAHLDNDPDVGPASPQWHATPGGEVPPIQLGNTWRDGGATTLVDLAEREIERDGDVRLTSVPFPDNDNYSDELPPADAQELQGADKAGSTPAAPLRAQLSGSAADQAHGRETTQDRRVASALQVVLRCAHGHGSAQVRVPADCGLIRGYSSRTENYGIIGNMRTSALIGTDASIDFMCFPRFDSPSVFCRLLDHHKGGYFQIVPKQQASRKQQYLPNSNVLVTRFLADEGASQVTDFFHVPEKDPIPTSGSANVSAQPTPDAAAYSASHHTNQGRILYPWVIRIVEAVRGTVTFDALCFPAFRYALDAHTTHIEPGNATVVFTSPTLTMDLRHVVMNPCCDDATGMAPLPRIRWETEKHEELKGPGVKATFTLHEGQQVWFVFRERPKRRLRDLLDPPLTVEFLQMLLRHTLRYWHTWISQSTYTGRWRESVQRSAFTLKLMTYQPTGAVIAAPTFSLPEEVGGDRNWDYRYVWLRDSAFTIYAFIRLGLLSEARNYMRFVEMVFKDGGPPRVMYTIDGATEMPELELTHLDGYRGSKPVRIGNAASNHLQLDISGALLDAIYLMNKFSSPIGYDMWVVCAKLVDFVVENWKQPDMSIWEVRGKPVNFLYSKVMSWVAVDRGLRLVEKRMFPCPNRDKWFRTRDEIYLEIMEKGWNHEGRFFQQAYENAVLDSSVLIMPLVFFMSPTDPRLLSTIAAILRAPERGGLTVNNLVRRYQVGQVDDGFESDEGAFTMCTLWLVEALTRAGQYYPKYLARALYAFDQTLAYGNHLLLFSEQVSPSGELVGNFPQAFTHIALISSAFNLDRVLGHRSVPDIV